MHHRLGCYQLINSRYPTLSQSSAFNSLDLNPEFLENLQSLGYESMTPIQAQSLPLILSGRDVIAQGKTGSGKTAAFGLGILTKIEVKRFCAQALVLCPTRELADQVSAEIRRLARSIANIKVLTLCGGSPVRSQVGSLEKGVHIVVGTPGRVEDHLKRETLDLQFLQTLVLDEADRMLDMGFEESLDVILKQVPDQRQTLLLSATYPEKIQSIAKRVMSEPEMIVVDSSHDEATIEQHFFKIPNGEQRLNALKLLLLKQQPESALVFCATRQDVREVVDQLHDLGFSVLPLHGELDQRDRDQTLIRFSNRSIMVLVATDVAARGLDIDSLDVVVNYHLGRDLEVHVHRVGRTGRAGGVGVAWSLYDGRDSDRIEQIEGYLGRKIKSESLPSPTTRNQPVPRAAMVTLQIDGGKKQKLRPGDILGALTGESGIEGSQVGKIKVVSNRSYVAVNRQNVKAALEKLGSGKLKGRSFRVRSL